MAVAYFQDKQLEKALEIFQQIYKDSPDNLKVLYNLAIIAKVQNKSSLAIDYFVNYRKYNSGDLSVNAELAELYYVTKQYNKVIEIANQSVMATDEKTQLLKAKSLIHIEQYSQAMELLTQINQYKPNNNEVLLLLAKLYSQVPDKNLRNGQLSVQYAQMAFNNETSQLSYWQLLMALDETEKCHDFEQLALDFAQLMKTEKHTIIAQIKNQRAAEFRCQVE